MKIEIGKLKINCDKLKIPRFIGKHLYESGKVIVEIPRGKGFKGAIYYLKI